MNNYKTRLARIGSVLAISVLILILFRALGEPPSTSPEAIRNRMSGSTDAVTVDDLVKEVNAWVIGQEYFTAIKGGDFTAVKRHLAEDEKFRVLAILAVIYKATNRGPMRHDRSIQMKDPMDPDEILRTNNPSCGQFAIVFRAIAERLNLTTRAVHLYQIAGSQLSHVLVEVRYGNRWHLVDPSFFGFYTRNGKPNGEIVGLEDILENPVLANNGIFPLDPANYQPSFEFLVRFYPEQVLDDLGVDLKKFKNGFFKSPATFSEAGVYALEGTRFHSRGEIMRYLKSH